MRRADAFEIVSKHGGKPREGVTRQTDILIVGELGWPLLDDGRPSNSLAQAKSYRIPVASERQFLAWVGRSVPEEQSKTYTAAQLASLSKLPAEVVDQLAMFGLIEARDGLYGFRDLAAARQVSRAAWCWDRPLGDHPQPATKSANGSPMRACPICVCSRNPRTGSWSSRSRAAPNARPVHSPMSTSRTTTRTRSSPGASRRGAGRPSTAAAALYAPDEARSATIRWRAFNLGNVLRSMGRKVEVEAPIARP